MIVKVQTSFTQPTSALIYDAAHSVQGEFDAAQLPDYVFRAAKKTGKAYFRAKMRGTKIEFGKQVVQQDF